MKLLLDTHLLLWAAGPSHNLSSQARQLIDDPENELIASTASLWEIAIKSSLGKLRLAQPFEQLIPQQLQLNAITPLGITLNHLVVVAGLPFHHRDPFDRLLIAQALAEQIPIVSADPVFDAYGVTRLW